MVLDALTYAGNRANLEAAQANENFSFVHGNICDTRWSRSCCASGNWMSSSTLRPNRTSIGRSPGPMRSSTPTSYGTHSMLKAARQVWLFEKSVPRHRFHQVSTDEVYGSLGPDDAPFSETTPYAPNSPYSASKAASDHLVRAYHHTYGLATTISNCSNNYGPYQFAEKLIPLMISRILKGEALPCLRGRAQRPRLAARGRSLPRARPDPDPRPGSVRSTTSAGNRNARTSPWCTSCVRRSMRSSRPSPSCASGFRTPRAGVARADGA